MFNPKKSKKDPKVLKIPEMPDARSLKMVWAWAFSGPKILSNLFHAISGDLFRRQHSQWPKWFNRWRCSRAALHFWRSLEIFGVPKMKQLNTSHMTYDILWLTHTWLTWWYDEIIRWHRPGPEILPRSPHLSTMSHHVSGDETADSGGLQRSACQCLGVSRLQPVIFHDIPWPSMKLPCWKTFNRIAMSSRV